MEFRLRAARVLVLAAAIFCVPACGGSDDDDESLVVTFTSPSNGTGSVPRQPVIYVRFNMPLKPASVSQATRPHSAEGLSVQGSNRSTASLSAVSHRPLASSGPSARAAVEAVATASANSRGIGPGLMNGVLSSSGWVKRDGTEDIYD